MFSYMQVEISLISFLRNSDAIGPLQEYKQQQKNQYESSGNALPKCLNIRRRGEQIEWDTGSSLRNTLIWIKLNNALIVQTGYYYVDSSMVLLLLHVELNCTLNKNVISNCYTI